MKVVLTHFHSLQNAGDAAGLAVSLAQLRQRLPAARFSVVSDHPEEPGYAALGVGALPSPAALLRGKQGVTALRQAFQQADLILQTPGNQLFSIGRLRLPMLLAFWQSWLAGNSRAPYYLLPCSLGPFRSAPEAALARVVLRRARQMYLREPLSLRLAQGWGLNACLAPDPVFLLPAAPPQAARAELEGIGWRPERPALGVSLIPRMTRSLTAESLRRQREAAARALTALAAAEPGLQLVFFPQVSGPAANEDDRQAASALAGLLPRGVELLRFPAGRGPALLKAAYGQMQAVLAGRLHAGLFAYTSGVPPLLLGYLSKSRGAAELLGWQEWLLNLNDPEPERLEGLLSRFWAARVELARTCQAQVAGLAAAALTPFDEITSEVTRG